METNALETLRHLMVSPPIVALPKMTGRYMLDTDACDKQIGWVLRQDQMDGASNPVGDWTRSLNKAEQAYDTYRECLAVVWSVPLLRPYLKGSQFSI